MALRQAANALNPWASKLSTSLWATGNAACGLVCSDSDETSSRKSSQQEIVQPSFSSGQQLANMHFMTCLGTQTPSFQAFRTFATLLKSSQSASSSVNSPMLPARRTSTGLNAQLPFGLQGQQQQQQQVRSINAWSPAQRYFVEGDHVITAEATRTLQFTGLDSGSFYPFVVWTAFATVVASIFVIVPFLVAPTRVDLDKSSAYECGFDAFGEARQTFSVSFYLVSIMYLLFDIEIAYLFPYVMTHANTQMFWTMNLFLGILVAGFVYEWGVGALEWRESEAH